jgi:hypothetical protein
MSPRLRLAIPVLLVVGVVAASLALYAGIGAGPGDNLRVPTSAGPGASGSGPGSSGDVPTLAPSPTPVPALGGTELYGYLPYWQMSDTVASYLDSAPLSTIALFSVSARRNGAIDSRDIGYKRITGELGRRIIDDAHGRGDRVELVFTSFGGDRNGLFFGRLQRQAPSPGTSPAASAASLTPAPLSSPAPSAPPWQRSIADLVALAVNLGVDGINVDVEQLDELDRDAYGEFLGALRAALVAAIPDARLTVATEAGLRGTGNATKAAAAGVDRLFLMGYDYHWSGSQPGASAPIDRSDGLYTIRWSIDQYVAAGVPRDHILLGLPLYGMTWRTLGPDRTSPVLGSGSTWIPNRHLDVLLDPGFRPGRDALEIAEFFVRPEGNAWRVTYYDSPATLRPKLALARDQGLAGGGFWAVGYERGLPGYVELMRDFRAGEVGREEAPPAP